MVSWRRILLAGALASAVLTTSCNIFCNLNGSCPKDDDDDDDDAPLGATVGVTSGSQPGGGTSATSPLKPVASTEPGAGAPSLGDGFALARLTPEQYSNDIVVSGNFGADTDELREFNTDIGQTLDYLQLQFGVPLGGVDFVSASRRDRETKAQTLLISRVLAWELAGAIVWKDYNKGVEDAASREVFTKIEFDTDHPYIAAWDSWRESDEDKAELAAMETRWAEQVDDLFWRFYARPPSASELDAVKTMFATVAETEGYPGAGWVALVYAILASQEYWHL